jgi:hypothetical protein
MADLAYRNDSAVYKTQRTAWGAIWAGMFTFVAIWSVFGMLGEAIFATSANPNSAAPVGGMSVGLGVWSTILTIIAMYVAGRVTGHFSDVPDRAGRLMHGMTMFGLTVISVVVMIVLGGTAMSGGAGVAGSTHSPYMLEVFSDIGWIGFVSLFLGWLAAMGGAAQGGVRTAATRTEQTSEIRGMRPAA